MTLNIAASWTAQFLRIRPLVPSGPVLLLSLKSLHALFLLTTTLFFVNTVFLKADSSSQK